MGYWIIKKDGLIHSYKTDSSSESSSDTSDDDDNDEYFVIAKYDPRLKQYIVCSKYEIEKKTGL